MMENISEIELHVNENDKMGMSADEEEEKTARIPAKRRMRKE